MRKTIKCLISFAVSLIFSFSTIFGCLSVTAYTGESDEIPFRTYTYWQTETGEKTPVYGHAMYETKRVISAESMGQEFLTKITDICTDEKGNIYILDGEASCIYILDSKYALMNIIKNAIDNNQPLAFKGARGIYSKDGEIYICDTENARVLVTDTTGNMIQKVLLPDSELIPENFTFRPVKIAVDSNNYLYILSEGSYYGAILCSDAGEFLSFYGANAVSGGITAFLQKLWNKITMTNTKRSKTSSKIPYQFNDIYIDDNNFVYTATGSGIKTGQVKKLSPGGVNVFSTTNYNYADAKTLIYYDSKGISKRQSDTSNIAVGDCGYLYLLDSSTGRIFLYDSESRLLSAFGGGMQSGTQSGNFKMAQAIELNGSDVLVADSSKNTVTVFTATQYGNTVMKARLMTIRGEYADSTKLWQEALAVDKNNQLAYIGLAKAAYSNGNYQTALEYARIGNDKNTYSQALKYIRNDFLRRKFNLIAIATVLIIALVIGAVLVLKRKKSILFGNVKLKCVAGVFSHPFDSFVSIREKNCGSTILAATLMLIFYVFKTLEQNLSGFLFSKPLSSDSNTLLILLRTVGFVTLWTVSNWMVTVLIGGRGKIRDVFIVTCYSLIPMIVYSIGFIILSNFLLSSEAAFLNIISVISVFYTAILMIIGHISIHELSFKKAILSFVLTLLSMAIIVFFVFILIILIQQFYSFLVTVITEIRYL